MHRQSNGDDVSMAGGAVSARRVEAAASVSTGDGAVSARGVEEAVFVSTGGSAVGVTIAKVGARHSMRHTINNCLVCCR